MTNIQELLSNIQNTWGKLDNASIDNGNIKRLKIFKDGQFFADSFGRLNASNLTGCTVHAIKKVLNGRLTQSKGYYFVYQDKWNGETFREKKRAGRKKTLSLCDKTKQQ